MKELSLALQEIESICEKNIEEKEIPEMEKELVAQKLQTLGFRNSETVKRADKSLKFWKEQENRQIQMKETRKNLKNYVSKLKVDFPTYKIIFYDQLIDVAEKYDLYLGTIDLFRGEIPEEHAQKILDFPHKKCEKEWPTFRCSYDTRQPLLSQHITGDDNRGNYYKLDLYVCADRPNFLAEKDIITVGREIFRYKEPPMVNWKYEVPDMSLALDPIILKPIWLPLIKKLAFIIITAWGPESKDLMVFNEQNN